MSAALLSLLQQESTSISYESDVMNVAIALVVGVVSYLYMHEIIVASYLIVRFASRTITIDEGAARGFGLDSAW